MLSAIQAAQQCIAMRTQCFSGLGDITTVGQESMQRSLKYHRICR